MFILINEYMDFLEKTHLSQAQALYLFLLYSKRYDLIIRYKQLYPTEDGFTIGSNSTHFLIENDYIKPVVENGDVIVDYILTDKFYQYFISMETAWITLVQAYPDYYISKENTFLPAKQINLDDASYKNIYYNNIGCSQQKHLKVLEIANEMRKAGRAETTLATFIVSKDYERIIKLNEAKKN